ncbi:unnamed protein product [Aspergillus oryzae var. brunneus]|uniref:Unnamed protein product n=1 Tax=Aspergillus oryzae var. brunneus TaxID=332754 RepID=A0ABQ6KT83_ASPOZ|nr:unnamed protein product [Aspergillus oryzae]GMG47318.1 unnamed protein product [Aspergillus oryzae var. brunneus]
MYHSGIGGGGIMLVRTPNSSYEVIDFRETAPAAAFKDMYEHNKNASVGVPGEIRGLEYLHSKYGVLPWSTVVQPAVQTARRGFPVGEDLIRYMNHAAGYENFFTKNPTWAIDFAPGGARLNLGDTMTRHRYADTLEAIAKYGPSAFYSGRIAETMINALQNENGTMTLGDLQNYTVAIRNISQIDYRGYKITSTSAPSSGVIALYILKVLETYKDLFRTEQSVNLNFSIPGSSDLFGYIPSETNYVYPGKRPLSSITPVIVERSDGTLVLITGSAGGSRIITATVQNVIHSIDEGLSAADALAKPRLHDQLVPNQVTFEYNYDNDTVAFMKSLGHDVSWVAPGQSNAQLVRVLPNGTFDAAGEPRQVNSAGYSI